MINIDKEQLKEIGHLKTEIETIKMQIEDLENIVVSDKVKGSSSYYPYVARSFTIEGTDTNRIERLQRRLQRKIDDLMDIVEETNKFIDSIEDSLTRQIISLRYINGLPWNQVANSLGQGYTEDGVRMMCNRFLDKI